MKKRSARYTLILSGLLLCAVGAAASALLMRQPFGPIFNGFLSITVVGAVTVLAATGWGLIIAKRRWLRPLGALPTLAALVLGLLALALIIDSRLVLWWGAPLRPTTEQWLTDLSYLEEELPRRAPWLFELVSPATFEAEVAALHSAIPALADTEVRAGFTRLIALPRDAHSFPNVFSLRLGWHAYPLKIYGFDDGWYVIDSPRERPDLRGLRLVAIGGRPVSEVYEALKDYLAAESEYGWKDRFCNAVLVAEWLAAAGIAPDAKSCEFLFEDAAGERTAVRLRPVHFVPAFYWSSVGTVDNDSPPALGNDRQDHYVLELDETTRTALFRFHKVLPESNGETIQEFTWRLLDFSRSHEFERFVIDLRVNDGGNGALAPPLVSALAQDRQINRPGKLFVIVGRKTFSAAVMFAELLRHNTEAILVGEPTGQGPVFYSNPAVFELPESGMEFLVSQRLTAAGPFSQRIDALHPDIRTRYFHADYVAGRDPAMEAILAYEYRPPEAARQDPRVTERCLGKYRLGPCQTVNVERAGDGLSLLVTDHVPDSLTAVSTHLHPLDERSFQSGNGALTALFDLEETDSASAVTLTSGRRSARALRASEGWTLPMELFAEERFDEALAFFEENRARYGESCPHLEGPINALGYRLLREGRFDDSVKVFRANTLLFPASANTWDSLGEGYMYLGQAESAIASYEKSLELNPANDNAKQMLVRLRGGSAPG
jgi:tetratricopeptide (TPR) repeat protein